MTKGKLYNLLDDFNPMNGILDEAKKDFPLPDVEWKGFLDSDYRQWFRKWFGEEN